MIAWLARSTASWPISAEPTALPFTSISTVAVGVNLAERQKLEQIRDHQRNSIEQQRDMAGPEAVADAAAGKTHTTLPGRASGALKAR